MLSSDAGTPLQQAQYFIANVKAIGYTGKHAGELPPALDFEKDERTKKCPTGITNAGISNLSMRCGRRLAATRSSTPTTTSQGLRLRQPGIRPQHAALAELLRALGAAHLARVGNWTLWQYTSKAVVPGVPRQVDREYFNGSLRSSRRSPMAACATGATRDVNGDGRDECWRGG